MPNIASLLKSEISRIARKEVRAELMQLKKSAAAHRSDIAALKRRAQALEQALRRAGRTGPRAAAGDATDDTVAKVRFSPKSLASQRRRLGLSAADCGLLLDASSQSVYNWEDGSARPRVKHLQAIAALRTLGKRSAAAVLAELKSRDGS